MTTHNTLADLLSAIDMRAAGRGTSGQILARIQKDILDSGDSAMLAGIPSGQRRNALADAMEKAQTREGKRYAECILCGQPMSRTTADGTPVPSNAPMFPSLVTLIPSSLLQDEDTLSEVSPGSAPRLGYVPGNVALACGDCAAWKATPDGRDAVLSADIVDASMVLFTWPKGSKTRAATESEAWQESRARRAQARMARLS